jgi:hypothetical protein
MANRDARPTADMNQQLALTRSFAIFAGISQMISTIPAGVANG